MHALAVLAGAALVLAPGAQAGGPSGAQITSGSGSVSQSGDTTTVLQHSNNLFLNWQSFNVASNEVVNFEQPDSGAIAVNRILSNSGSEIFGHLNANGQVWLINPNGVLFGKGAQINVGGLTASTLDVNDAALSSNWRTFAGSGTGSVVNEGSISAAPGGYVALLGNHVENSGTIRAQLGTVALGAGSAETLTFDGRQLIHLSVDQSTLNNLAENNELIQADGGHVVMTAGAKDTLLASVVNNSGVIQAHTVENHNGNITLIAGMQAGEVKVGGTLDAAAPAGGPSGSIETSAAVVSVAGGAKVVAGPRGSWLIDPVNLAINAAAATTIDAALNAGTSVTELTTATTASGAGVQTAGAGDINVNAPMSWTNPAGTLTLTAFNAINVNAVVNGAGAVVMQAGTGNLTIAAGASIEGDAGVSLSTAANFINSAGASALSAGSSGSRWLVYSTSPTLDTTGGLAPGFIQYAAAAQATPAQATGNGLLYSLAPTLSVTTLGGTAAKTYDGGTAATLTKANSNYTVAGLVNGDSVSSMSATYASADVGSSINVTSSATVAGLTVVNTAGIAAYGYALSGSPVSAAIGTITPAQLTAAIINNPTKVYDGTTTATLTAANYGITGFAAGQSATVNQPSSVAFASRTAGAETVNATFANTNFVAGSATKLSNYLLPTSASGAGTVLQAPLIITGVLALDKVYDATTTDALNTTSAGLYGAIGSDAVTLSTSGATGTFASSNAGNNLAVTASGFTLSGAQQLDYHLVAPEGLSASITPATLTITGTLATNKIYNATTADLLNVSNAALSGIVGGDAATLNLSAGSATGTFASKNVGTGLAVSIAGFSLSGSSAANYHLLQPSGLTANISAAPLAVTLVGDPTKPYNGTTTAALSSANFSVTGFAAGEGASIPQTVLSEYDSPDAGARTVTATLAAPDFAPTGATLMSNYTFPTTATGAGAISPAPLAGLIVGNPSKVYDSTATATLTSANYALTGFLSGQGATVNQTSGTYASPNAGLEAVTATLSPANYAANSGTLLSNYLLPTTVSGSGWISQATLVGYVYAGISGNPTKPYDGTTTATLNSANFVLSGFTGGQGATVTQTVGTYASANAGTQTVTASLVAADFSANSGTNLANYHLPSSADGTGTITPDALVVTIGGDPTRVYNGSTSMALNPSNYTITGFVSGEGAQINPSALINYASANAGAENLTAALTSSAYTATGGTLLSNYVLATSASGEGHITPAPVYATGVSATNKVYDTTTADPLITGSVALTGVIPGDSANLALLGTATGSFGTVSVGNALPVAVTGYSLGGSASPNYALQPIANLAADITAAPLTITGVSAISKPYDGTNTASLSISALGLAGVLGSDNVTLSAATAAGTFSSINVGIGLKVSASGFVIGGAQANDYSVSQPSGLTASITPAPVTALITANPTKVYDGSSSVTLTAGNYTLTGFATVGAVTQGATLPQSATANYFAPDAGSGVAVTSTLVLSDFIANSGTNLSNYQLPTTGAGTGTITQAPLTVAIIGNPTKSYNSTTAAILTPANYELLGFVGSQSAAVNQASGSYGSANAGSQSVSATLAAGNYSPASGTNLNNYLLPTLATGPGTITPAVLTLSGVTTTPQIYNGTTVDALTGATLSGTTYATDAPILMVGTYSTGTLGSNGNVGTDSVTTNIQLTGVGSGNYSIIQPAGLSAVISPATLTATSSVNKIYDGTTSASLSGSNTAIVGFVAGQGAVVNSGVTGTFASPNTGTGITVTAGVLVAANLTANGGTLLSNYTLPTSDNGSGAITAATLTYNATASNQQYGITPTGLVGTVTGFVNSETLAGATTGTATFTTTATSSSNVGHYAINGSGLTANNGNYIFTQAAANAMALTIRGAPLTVLNVATTSRLYNGSTSDALTGATLTGTFYNGDTPVLTNATTGTLGSSGNVGTDSVTTSMGLSGTGHGNYVLTQPTGLSAIISAVQLTATSTVNKTYDGTTLANLAGANTVLSGFIGAQGATVKAGVTGSFADANVNTGIVVSGGALIASQLTANGGTTLANYTLPTSDNGTGTITAAIVNLGGTRVYDAAQDAAAAIFGSSGTVNGVNGETLTLTGSGLLAAKNVGAQSLSSRGSLALGNGTGGTAGLASNYTLTGGVDTVTVTPLAITVTGTANNKTYDATTTATVATLGSSGVLAGDTVNFADTSATFNTKNVATATTVTIAGISDSGVDAGNYTLLNTSTASGASITAAIVSLSGARIYDAGVDAAAGIFGNAGTVATGVGAETLLLSGSSTLVQKSAGPEGLSSLGSLVLGNGTGGNGGLASNYTLIGGSASVAVSKLAITVAGTASNKVYDATSIAAVATLGSSGVIAGDTVTFSDTGASFANKLAATGKTVTISGITDGGADAGNYSLSNATAVTTANITPLGLTVTATALNKTYNGLLTATVATLGSSGVIAGDTVTFADTAAAFSDKNVANGKTVTVSGITDGGADAGNYTLSNVTAVTTAKITPLAITVSGTGANKVYDGNVTDVVSLASAGVVSGDSVSFADTAAVFGNKNVANGKSVTISGITDSGADAGNYTLSNVTAVTTANITPLAITVSGTGANKVYDGNVTDVVSLASAGVVSGDSVSFADTSAVFGNKNVANGKSVSISGITDGGTDAGNYTLSNVTAATTANITPLAITVSGTGSNKVYDGNLTDVVTLASLGVLPGDVVNFADTSASFADKNAGTGKAVSILGISASGAQAGNYLLNNVVATTTADITPLTIIVAATALNKTYDGSVLATVSTLGSGGVIAGDTVAFADTVAAFGDKNVANGKTVTVSGITDSGIDAANYALANTVAITTANITPLGITVAATALNKTYDGSVVATVSTLGSNGVIAGDTVTFADASAAFGDKNVANGKSVTILGITDGGADAGNYTLSNAIATTTANITPLAITVSATGTNKVYDGNVTDVVTLASGGVLAGDTVSFTDASAAFSDKNVANGKSVTILGITDGGTDAGNYTLNNATATASANITPLGITVSGIGTNKVYDGNVTDVVTLASVGVLPGDTVSFADTSAVFADRNVATGKTVTVSGITDGGLDAGNYTLNNTTATTTANITPLGITVSGTGSNKVYDGNLTDVVTLASAGVLAGDSVSFADTSATFADKNAGTGKGVSILGISSSGAQAGNYTLDNATATTTANITPLAITVSGSGTNKVYDGNVTDVVSLASAGVLAGDTVSFAAISAGFADKNVGTGKSVTILGITDSGIDAGNYTISNATATTTANVTPLAITVSALGTDKVYDGNLTDVVTLASGGVLSGDTVSFADTSAAFGDKNVANGKTVTVSGITDGGADAGNYTLSNATATTTANITPLAITVAATAANKVYDGSASATVTTLTSAGVLSGDTVTFSDTSAAFAGKNVGADKSVTISGIAIGGTDGFDYAVNSVATASANISPLVITVSGTGTNKVYDGNVSDAVTLASSGIVAGDVVTFDDTAATFANKNVGSDKTVSVVGITAAGADAANYTLGNTSAVTRANITPATLTETATATSDDDGKLPPLTGSVSGFVAGDTLANASAGALVWLSNASAHPQPGLYAIYGAGLSAPNYVVVQAPGNLTALDVTADRSALAQDDFGFLQQPIAGDTIATPYGIGSSDDQANNTGNARSDAEVSQSNRHLTDFSGHLALVVIRGGLRLPQADAH